MDSQMRTKARLVCGDRSLGDDIWHNAVLKILTSYNDRTIENKNVPGLLYSAIVSSFMDNKRRNGISMNCTELKYAEQEIVDNEKSILSFLSIKDILSFLDTINHKHRDIFLMNAFGMDNVSISYLLGESLENVRKIVVRTRNKIKTIFKDERNF